MFVCCGYGLVVVTCLLLGAWFVCDVVVVLFVVSGVADWLCGFVFVVLACCLLDGILLGYCYVVGVWFGVCAYVGCLFRLLFIGALLVWWVGLI